MSKALIPDAVPDVVIGVLVFDIQFFGNGQDDVPTVELNHIRAKGWSIVNGQAAPGGSPLSFERRSPGFDFKKPKFCHE